MTGKKNLIKPKAKHVPRLLVPTNREWVWSTDKKAWNDLGQGAEVGL